MIIRREELLMPKTKPTRYSEPGTHVPPSRPKLPFPPDTSLEMLRRAVAASRRDVPDKNVPAAAESQT